MPPLSRILKRSKIQWRSTIIEQLRRLLDFDQHLSSSHLFAGRNANDFNGAIGLSFYPVEHFHGFKDHHGVARLDGIADLGFDRGNDPRYHRLDGAWILLLVRLAPLVFSRYPRFEGPAFQRDLAEYFPFAHSGSPY
jgi:hypothetical protein